MACFVSDYSEVKVSTGNSIVIYGYIYLCI